MTILMPQRYIRRRNCAISMAWTQSEAELIAAATEWYEKGIITKEDTQGIELKWGNYETMIEDEP